ncbi:MAG TPA: glycosyltransferase family 39 protein [Roseiflexaceae bacterium]|nr:glycosyltransferase family 39 protein [Roseiflexaceae bacterium]
MPCAVYYVAMIATPKTTAFPASLTRTRARVALASAAIFFAALLPRALDLGGFLTLDEANFWLARSEAFLAALRRGDWAATAISTHPGVTTMWLGAAGLLLREALVDPGLLPGDFPTALALMRLPGAIVHAAAVALGYLLLRRMLPTGAALLAALLWAADPFVVAYSRLLHVDALAGTFITLSLLAALVGNANRETRNAPAPLDDPAGSHSTDGTAVRWSLLSGVFGGLALLSKTPALILLPCIGVICLSAEYRESELTGARSQRSATQRVAGTQHVRRVVVGYSAWLLCAAATAFALWPALWVDPLGALAWLRTGVEAEGAQPHMLGNFFLGRQDDAPGPLFYPVALALRLTPWTLLGVLLLPLALRAARGARDTLLRRDVAALALYVVLLVLALSLFPKKFNRYVVPAFPALDILAAVGLLAPLRLLERRSWGRRASPRLPAGRLQAALVAVASIAALANAAYWHPYGIAAFNQALGGAAAGARTFAVGWGEGMEQAAAWLNAQPDITGVAVVSRIPVVQAPYMRHGAHARTPQAGALPEGTGYVVVYVSQVQRGAPSPPFDRFYGRAAPLHTVRIHGVEYAWIYQAPPPVAEERPAAFGAAIRLRGFDMDGRAAPGATVVFRLRWESRAAAPLDYTLFAHLIGPGGRRYAQVDLPLPTSSWQPGRYPATELPLAIPQDAPPGVYHMVIGLYEPATGQRLPLVTTLPTDPSLSGADALPLAALRLER